MSKTIRILLDITLIVLLPVLVAFCFTGRFWHEWLGVGMAAAVVAHHAINPAFFRKLFSGKYNCARFLLVTVNLAILADFLFLLVSGLSFSAFVMGWIDLKAMRPDHPDYFVFMRYGHVCACFWGVVLMGLHLGQHAQQMSGMLKLNKPPKPAAFLAAVALAALAVYGCYVFVDDGWFSYLFAPKVHVFKNLGLSSEVILFHACAAVVFFAFAGHLLQKSAKRVQKKASAS